ncbi:polyprenyl synthetase family protein [Candidatus Saccharibacteria bacterium]|nr:MAG: polyprenyl synthetase family protein [Candidatus Saccharibacteria bacterium]
MSTVVLRDKVLHAVDAYIKLLLQQRRDRAVSIGHSYEALWSHTSNMVMNGGKRIRPYLTFVGYGAYDERLVPVAAAQELAHVAMLMHDDIIDQDDVRRGVPNMNGIYKSLYGGYLDTQLSTHYAHAAAMLAGDALLSEAYRLVYSAGYDQAVTTQVVAQLHESIYEVIGGELLDVEAGFVTDTVFDPLIVYRYKTSSYSFIGPLLSGAYCAGVDEATIETLRQYAINVGIAFQIEDDLLGVFGNESATGKSNETDLREGKLTALITYHREGMNDEQRQRFAVFGNADASSAELAALRVDLEASGARQKTRQLAERYFTTAMQHLQALEPGPRRTELEQFTRQLRGRQV